MLITSIVQDFFSVLEKENIKLHWRSPDVYLDDPFERLIPSTYDYYLSRFAISRMENELKSIRSMEQLSKSRKNMALMFR